jgi:hypothetical protein
MSAEANLVGISDNMVGARLRARREAAQGPAERVRSTRTFLLFTFSLVKSLKGEKASWPSLWDKLHRSSR